MSRVSDLIDQREAKLARYCADEPQPAKRMAGVDYDAATIRGIACPVCGADSAARVTFDLVGCAITAVTMVEVLEPRGCACRDFHTDRLAYDAAMHAAAMEEFYAAYDLAPADIRHAGYRDADGFHNLSTRR